MTATSQRITKLSQTWIALLSAAAILIHLCSRYLIHMPADVSEIPLYVAVAAGGMPLLWRLGQHLVRMEFGSDLLAGLSILAAAITGQFLVGAIIVLMLSGGGALEILCHRSGELGLAALQKRTPRVAHRRSGSGCNPICRSTT